MHRDDKISHALKETRALLKMARGELARNESSSRAQRKRLRQALRVGVSAVLAELMSGHQVVELWVTFLQYLLEVGGVRVDTYRFNTLVTYQSRVLEEVYRAGWDVDLLSLDEDALEQFYERVLSELAGQARADAWTVLQRFHECLQAWYGVPRCPFFPGIERPPRSARSMVLPPRIVHDAVATAAAFGGRRSDEKDAAADALALQFSHGLRTLEGHGLRHRDFLLGGVGPLRVQRNSTRGLKTLPRIVPVSLAGAPLRARVTARLKQTIRHDRRGRNASLFPNPVAPETLVDHPTIAGIASRAMKLTTGDPTATPYNLRHSFATSLMSTMLMPVATTSPIAKAICEELALGPETTEELTACQPSTVHYPFQVDRLGMWLGHSGHETLAVKYWHGAWWVAGEYCARQSDEDDLAPAVFAAFEGIDRAIVVRRMSKLDAAASRRKKLSDAVRNAVERSGVPALGPSVETSTAPGAVRMTAVSQDALSATLPAPLADPTLALVHVDTVLILRRRYDEPLDGVAVRCASDLAVCPIKTQRLLAGYAEVASETRMHDFEPDKVRTGRSALLGVDAAHARRCGLLARIGNLAADSIDFRATTASIVTEWRASVSAGQPRLVSRSVERLWAHLHWLALLGYRDGQIEVACHAVPESFMAEVRLMKCKVVAADGRLGRTARIGPRQEFAIDVSGSQELPNSRDLQRVLLGLAAWLEGDLAW